VAPFQNTYKSGKNKDMVMGPDGARKPRMTVLLRASSNLLEPVRWSEWEFVRAESPPVEGE
jgi:hypothetical protein